MAEAFATVLRRLREARGLSRVAVSRLTGLDPGYMTRCEQGQRVPTSRPAVLRIAAALGSSEAELNALIVAAGFLPEELDRVGPDDSDILLLARLLMPGAMPEATQRAVRGVVRSLGYLLPESGQAAPTE